MKKLGKIKTLAFAGISALAIAAPVAIAQTTGGDQGTQKREGAHGGRHHGGGEFGGRGGRRGGGHFGGGKFRGAEGEPQAVARELRRAHEVSARAASGQARGASTGRGERHVQRVARGAEA